VSDEDRLAARGRVVASMTREELLRMAGQLVDQGADPTPFLMALGPEARGQVLGFLLLRGPNTPASLSDPRPIHVHPDHVAGSLLGPGICTFIPDHDGPCSDTPTSCSLRRCGAGVPTGRTWAMMYGRPYCMGAHGLEDAITQEGRCTSS